MLLQLAHPWVAGAIAQHSRTLPTRSAGFTAPSRPSLRWCSAPRIEALAVARGLHHRHAEISGILTEDAGAFAAGSPYRANDLAALRWVHATLTDSALVAYQLINPPLSTQDRERYYTESRLYAALFGIPQTALPYDWADFAAYVDGMSGSDVLAVSGDARSIAAQLLSGAGTGWRMPLWYRALTALLLPPRLRAGFRLPYGRARTPLGRAGAHAPSLCLSPFAGPTPPCRALPRGLCPARRAARPGALTRALNRFWIGQSSMAVGAK